MNGMHYQHYQHYPIISLLFPGEEGRGERSFFKILPHRGPWTLSLIMDAVTTKQHKPGFEEPSELSKTFNIRMTLTSTKVKAVEQGIYVLLIF